MLSLGLRGEQTGQIVANGYAYYLRGDLEQAEQHYRAALNQDPFNVDALMLLGLLLSKGIVKGEAEALLQRYDKLVPNNPIALRNLGIIAQHRQDDVAAIDYLSQVVAMEPRSADHHYTLGVSQHRLGRTDAARQSFREAVVLQPDHSAAWHDLGASFEETDELALAEHAYRQAIMADPTCARAYGRLGTILDHLRRPSEAAWFWAELAREVRFDVVPCIGPTREARILLVGGAAQCNIRPKFLFPSDRFETVQVDLLSAADADDTQAGLLDRLGEFDLAFCLIADPDRGAPFFGEAQRLCAKLTCPILNPPDERLVRRTRREAAPALLDGIPGLIVPATRSMSRADLLAMGTSNTVLKNPVLVRPAGSHVGEALTKIEDVTAIQGYVECLPYEAFYVTDYHDYRSADGLHRKYRFIFVDRQIYPYHLAIADHWMLHYFRAETKDQAWMRREEEDFLAAPERVFGPLLAAVSEIARRMDLDYAGIDCGITADGQLVLFEANASMLAHLNDPIDIFPYKHRYVPRIFDAVTRMVDKRLG